MPPRSRPPSGSSPRSGASSGGNDSSHREPGGRAPGTPSHRPRLPPSPGRPAGAAPGRGASQPGRRPARRIRETEREAEESAAPDFVDELTQDCFNAVIALRHIDEAAAKDPERIQRHFRKLVSKMIQEAPTLRIPHEDAQEMAYAIVALADEVALNGPQALSHYWMGNLLQMHFFDENAAGEGFFDRLDEARASRRYDVLKVYYLCLMLGFAGRYAMRGGETELADIVASVRDTLARDSIREPESLSPQGERPKEAATAPAKTLRLIWIPVGAVAAAAMLYVTLASLVAHRASLLTDFIDTLVK
jgi:type VI secretion system protein ImpK